MLFKDRKEAGELLCPLLEKYKGTDVVVYAIPRGGVTVAEPIAKHLNAPIDLLLTHKIGHPMQPEYAIAAVSESGLIVLGDDEFVHMNQEWMEDRKKEQINEIKLKREKYLGKRNEIPIHNKIAIVVDDGIATGLTLQAGIKELKSHHPKKIVIAVPVAPESTADFFKTLVDDFVAVKIPENYTFLGSIGAYYDDFSQVEDDQVTFILDQFQARGKNT